MKSIFVFLFLISPVSGFAQSMVCKMINRPGSSELKIQYDIYGAPIELALRSPNETKFRPQDWNIEVVEALDLSGHESFSVKPKVKDIDWSQEPQCFKEVGTLLYFLFWHNEKSFYVQFYPYLVTKDNSCIPPRFIPQTEILECVSNR